MITVLKLAGLVGLWVLTVFVAWGLLVLVLVDVPEGAIVEVGSPFPGTRAFVTRVGGKRRIFFGRPPVRVRRGGFAGGDLEEQRKHGGEW